MSDDMDQTVGVIGLGRMGLGMARALSERGFVVRGFDLSENQRRAAEEAGIPTVPDMADVFPSASVVILSLPTAQDVADVVTSQTAHLGIGAAKRTIVVDTTTSEPDVSRQLAVALESAGHGFLDAPVSGGPAGAAAGALTMMIGGNESDVALARPVLDALATTILHVGPSGAGNIAKLVNNLLAAAHMVTTGESLRLAAAAGLDPAAALRVINAASGRSMISEVHFPKWIMSERFDSGFSMALMRKDVRLASRLAAHTGAELPLSTCVSDLWLAGSQHLADTDDFTRMGVFSPSGHRPGEEA